ncbi:MAG: dihydrofolate reductase [Oscillospiraceae bacterium]
MIAIVAAAENWAIGKEGQLLFSLPSDMRRFRTLTSYMTVVMGRKTLDSLPGGKPLPRRRNIVLTSRSAPIEGAETVGSVEELLRLVAEEPPEEVYVIGGGQVYAQLLPYCDKVLLTRVYASPEADAFFPDLDADPAWRVAGQSEMLEENGIKFQFIDYIR